MIATAHPMLRSLIVRMTPGSSGSDSPSSAALAPPLVVAAGAGGGGGETVVVEPGAGAVGAGASSVLCSQAGVLASILVVEERVTLVW